MGLAGVTPVNAVPGAAVHPDVSARAAAFAKPYKGPESYQVEDSGLFYGRDAEAEQLIARIMSARFTLLHAQSGAGKTSLLNASIVPGLEARGWFPMRILPQNDPVASTRTVTLQYLLPPPEAEVIAIRRACRLLELDERTATIADVIGRFDTLPKRDPRKREAISPLESPELARDYPTTGAGRITPYACRVMRASLDLETASEQWNVLRSLAGVAGMEPLAEDLPLAELLRALSSPQFIAAYRSLVSYLDPPGRCSLADFFANLVDVYGRRFSRFGLVLLFDQFEEIFTRFVDAGAEQVRAQSTFPDWRLRWAFFEELDALYRREIPLPDASSPPAPMPIRFVISMRSEYIGQLGPVRVLVPALDHCTAHLQLLSVDAAKRAIQAPAHEFGYAYQEECYQQIVADLTKEERYVEPTHLQVVCEHLWNARGKDLAERAAPAQGDALPELPLSVYQSQARVQGIMKAFLWGYLNGLERRDRVETVEMLEELITPGGTRNIVAREYLVARPFRNGDHRGRLLGQLVNRSIVRSETRLGGQFVEITHEFLIPPIREAIQTVLSCAPDHKRFVRALEALERAQDTIEATAPSLMPWDFEALDRKALEVEWPPWAVEAMFRNAVAHEAAPEAIERWAMRLNERENGAGHG